MELEAAARAHFLSIPAVAGYVGTKVWKHRLEHPIDGTGGRAIVVKRDGGWALPESRNTQEYPLLRVEFWADHTRGANGEILTYDGMTAAQAVYRALDPVIHGVRDQWWGATQDRSGMLVIGCQRYGEPYPSDGSDLAVGQRYKGEADDYESANLIVNYAIQTVH